MSSPLVDSARGSSVPVATAWRLPTLLFAGATVTVLGLFLTLRAADAGDAPVRTEVVVPPPGLSLKTVSVSVPAAPALEADGGKVVLVTPAAEARGIE